MAIFRLQPLRLALARYSTVEFPQGMKNKKLPAQTRYHPDLLIHKYLENNEKIDQAKWAKIRDEMLSTRTLHVNNVNLDAVILDTCCALDQHMKALDYCNYLKSQNYKFNLATTARYFKLITDRQEPLTEDERKDVIQLYDTIRKEYPVLDATTAEACIRGISRTSKWRDSLELMKMIEESSKPRGDAFRSIICAAFENNEPHIAWEFITRIGPLLPLDREIYKSFLKYCTKVSKSKEELEANIERLFDSLVRWDIYPWVEVMEEFTGVMEKYGWSGRQTSIRTNGICSNCGHVLSQLGVSEKDFEYLSKSFMSRALVGKDVYDKTTPQELAKFKRFIAAAKPYDVVIDGLNVEYSLWNNKTRLATGEKLAQVVRMFLDQDKKIMVFGRKHMLRWKSEHMEFIQNNTHFFVANNTSEDDPYLIYAALSGGVKTYLVSKDLMRQHKFILSDPELQKIFKFWLLTRQIHHTMKGHLKNKTIFLIYPPSYLPVAQKDENGWHIPSMENHRYTQPSSYDLAQPWYCLRRNSVEGKMEPKRQLENSVKG